VGQARQIIKIAGKFNPVHFAQNWNDGVMEHWDIGFLSDYGDIEAVRF
jgi:hypothetical protein